MGMNKVLLILLLTAFSHSALSTESCRRALSTANRIFTKLRHPSVSIALTHPLVLIAIKEMDGYILMANQYFNGNMKKTYFTMQKILGEEKFKELGWRLFNGTVFDFKITRNILINPKTGKINPNYIGQDKLWKFALFFDGSLSKAYMRAFTVLTPTEFEILGWKKNSASHEWDDLG